MRPSVALVQRYVPALLDQISHCSAISTNLHTRQVSTAGPSGSPDGGNGANGRRYEFSGPQICLNAQK